MFTLDIKKKLEGIFSRYDKIKVAYLFGSHAANKDNKLSDIDLGILLDDDYNRDIKLSILADLAEVGLCNIDLVLLNEAPLMMKFEIVKYNNILFKRQDFNAAEYFSITVREYLDFKPFIEVQRRYFKERLLNG